MKTITSPIVSSLVRLLPRSNLLIVLAVPCLVLLPNAQAVVPAPDGGYPGGNTAEGQNALFNLTTGGFNTAVGYFSLRSDTTGAFNTAIGAGALLANTAEQITATGAGALLSNTTGCCNTANGAFALLNNTEGGSNEAFGFHALLSNTTGSWNNAFGGAALNNNTIGDSNCAFGDAALLNNTQGGRNVAVGRNALVQNNIGGANVAVGFAALAANTGGFFNTALGDLAGVTVTGSGNVCIGPSTGFAGQNNTTWIANVYNSQASTRTVYVDADNKIGTLSSSRRYKEDIKAMDKASEALFSLSPVTFRYKKEIDRFRTPQFGLVAEEVAGVNADLVTRDRDGKPETVRYDAVNAMLLNEFLKEHLKVQKLEAALEAVNARLKKHETQLNKISAPTEARKVARRFASTE